ncbi:dihydrofolate reductase family protein [Mesorhizobium sp. BAC0120]|uniref:dihydrofolate reductase family protein n=1 Tax=Mesorhizobium sp. BAC0120 TaxID=3090670 RepID=UPI00298BF810|nr:dihydrofolate reductase family protein [Mesorhizobium sp. BAC0120]MDW6021914.1 dihydrofolate reductase family protein [Mesorhizobium sp. BAC0120]
MRKIVLQMMTTLNGRLDDPLAWLHGVSDDQYREIDRLYASYDTILVGRTTYEEMAAYWPGAVNEGTEANRSMARRMNAYKKVVFSRSGREGLTEWVNVEQVVVRSDADLARYLTELKARPGGDIHLSGGASLAQSVIGLGLVDEFRFFVYPVVSQGESWFAKLTDKHDLELLSTGSYENGVVALHYVPRQLAATVQPSSFTDLLT